jgi:hypothetical protein
MPGVSDHVRGLIDLEIPTHYTDLTSVPWQPSRLVHIHAWKAFRLSERDLPDLGSTRFHWAEEFET